MTIDIHKHNLVPKHSVISQKEKEALIESMKITVFELPKIKKKDPVIHGLGVKSGDVVKIIRDSATSGKSIFYRVVTNE